VSFQNRDVVFSLQGFGIRNFSERRQRGDAQPGVQDLDGHIWTWMYMDRAPADDAMTIDANDPVAVAVVQAIQTGGLAALTKLVEETPALAKARLVGPGPSGGSRTLLHIVTDWPGHFPNGPATVRLLVRAGADVNARFQGQHAETPLHWAASSNDVDVLEALLDAGADLEAPGAVIGGGTPLADATAFGNWDAARRLVARGAKTSLFDAAALGLMNRLEEFFSGREPLSPDEVSRALWAACHGGQHAAAEYLLRRGGDINWIPPWERRTPLDAALRSDATALAAWLRSQGAKSANSDK
jgi:hypothetical protein